MYKNEKEFAFPKAISFNRNGFVEKWRRPTANSQRFMNEDQKAYNTNNSGSDCNFSSSIKNMDWNHDNETNLQNVNSSLRSFDSFGNNVCKNNSIFSTNFANYYTESPVEYTSSSIPFHNFINRSYSKKFLDLSDISKGSTFCRKYRWVDDMKARHSVIIAFTAFYAMVLTIFALVFELSRQLSGENRRAIAYKDMFFGAYMYGVSVAFLIYCYIVLLLNPRWQQNLLRAKFMFKEGKQRQENKTKCVNDSSNNSTNNFSSTTLEKNTNPSDSIEFESFSSSPSATIEIVNKRKISHDSPSAGSLFLRLGCIVFGVIGIVYYAFSAYLCASDYQCDDAAIILDILSIVFVFMQMHFVFCNWKLSITGSQTVARFGTMHLIAANLWTWIRYILIEESNMNDEIKHVFTRDIAGINNETNDPTRGNTIMNSPCQEVDCVLASLSEVMYTSIVEYSLISAGLMLIVWRNVDFERKLVVYVKRKHQIRINCSKTTNGLFLGLAYLAGTFTTMAIFSGYNLTGQSRLAVMVFGCSDIAQYVLAITGCIVALWQLRQLYFHSRGSSDSLFTLNSSGIENSKNNQKYSQELLDIILLAFGMTGEMIYSVAGLLGLSAYNNNWELLSTILLLVHITRITQVALQSCLIYIAGKLSISEDTQLQNLQPGKQAITFLLLANISMFLMNLLEAEKAGISDAVVDFYGRRSWVFLVRSFSPLTIFYRFHSSVCLAEVWKTTYSIKA